MTTQPTAALPASINSIVWVVDFRIAGVERIEGEAIVHEHEVRNQQHRKKDHQDGPVDPRSGVAARNGEGDEEEENQHLKATPDVGHDADRIVEI